MIDKGQLPGRSNLSKHKLAQELCELLCRILRQTVLIDYVTIDLSQIEKRYP